MRCHAFLGGLAGLILAALPHAALAQRASENVTTQSSDAFGRTIGNEKSGLYTSDDVRGFNPVDAGNVRLEGLYLDLVDRLSPRLVEGSTIRVGPASQRHPFPAPTGLVDFALTQPGDEATISIDIDTGSSSSMGLGGSVEFQLPFDGRRLGLSGGVGGRHTTRPEGGTGWVRTVGGTLAWRPAPRTEVLLFAADFALTSDEARPTLYPLGSALPPRMERGVDLGQSWTGRHSHTRNLGGIVKLPLGGMQLEAGLFHTRRSYRSVFADILSGVASDGSYAARRIVADGGTSDGSLSGELRLLRAWRTARLDQQITFSLRGRSRDRRFGGSKVLALGPGSLAAPDPRAEPAYALGPKNDDHVRQITFGAAYSVVWDGGLSLDASLSQSRYRKTIEFADPLLADARTNDEPTTWNLSGSWRIARRVTLYAGLTHGQEEALVAPDIAVNRSEAPAAIHTRQMEAGLKLGLTDRLTLIAGGFSISKPYFNLDPALRYRELGTLSNRGIELSLTGQVVPGLSVVGGTMFLDPRISGEAVDSGQIGPRPVGQVRRRSQLNLDWRLAGGKSPLSFDLAVESLSGRTGNAANTLSAPARTTVNLGARYRFKAAGGSWLLRPLVVNLFDSYGWNVSTSGGWTYTAPRSLILQLVADF